MLQKWRKREERDMDERKEKRGRRSLYAADGDLRGCVSDQLRDAD